MTRDTYSDRERAVRAEIEKQAPDLKLKYVTEFNPIEVDGRTYQRTYAGFDLGERSHLKGFNVLTDIEVPPEYVAAHLIASARTMLAQTPIPDALDWSKP